MHALDQREKEECMYLFCLCTHSSDSNQNICIGDFIMKCREALECDYVSRMCCFFFFCSFMYTIVYFAFLSAHFLLLLLMLYFLFFIVCDRCLSIIFTCICSMFHMYMYVSICLISIDRSIGVSVHPSVLSYLSMI
jgi:hypothetical protein